MRPPTPKLYSLQAQAWCSGEAGWVNTGMSQRGGIPKKPQSIYKGSRGVVGESLLLGLQKNPEP